ncbi:penicillin-binding protein [Citricoccus sp. SGAir0253]|uniref:penicillin-binding transpeptidase domain-containing protein n=1 Tax=Citricoccus sp. SGAir0253 TaxID=2567881 RepID=UPI0010CCCDBA|nr:penicillin-binding transpeptidase domain-containing protein [Citricoccus sp. SGAir0253]QCU77307.1 penicillin-binding protein [Citricoccus sp. SGAir0253]
MTQRRAHGPQSPAPARPGRAPLPRAAAAGLAATLVLSTTGCLGPSRPSPEDTAGALATAISAGDLSAVPLTEPGARAAAALPEALPEGLRKDVTVTTDAVEVHGDDPARATARYTVRRGLAALGRDGEAWTYRTDAELVWEEDSGDGGRWAVDLRPDDVVAGLAPGGTVTVRRTAADRGDILDAAGDPLVTEREVAVLGLDKARVEPDRLAASARRVAEVAGVDEDAFVARAEAAGDRAFVEAITLRADGSVEVPRADLERVPGGRVVEDTAVLAPTRTFARDVLGTYGEPSAEQVEDSDGALEAGVAVGLSGLQATWQDRLAGSAGLVITVDNPDDAGASPAVSAPAGTGASADVAALEEEPVPGKDLASTLDRRVQAAAEEVVGASDVPAGLVAIRPSDGHVLAAASGPEGWPVAVSGAYAPGSTFKVVTSLALLREGLRPDDTVQCPATIDVDGMVVGNYDGYPDSSLGAVPFSEAFAESCNTVFVGAHDEVSAAREAEAARALGLDPEPATGLDGAFLGSVPEDSSGTEHAANLFGQGVVEASPLGMATVAASVAAGHTVRPVFVADPAVDTPPAPATGVTDQEAATLRTLMAGVVEHGTAEMLRDVPGAPVLAKTGTAQFVADGEDLAHTWLIAIHGDLAVALFLNEGLGGGHDNGPLVRDFLTAVEGVLPSE